MGRLRPFAYETCWTRDCNYLQAGPVVPSTLPFKCSLIPSTRFVHHVAEGYCIVSPRCKQEGEQRGQPTSDWAVLTFTSTTESLHGSKSSARVVDLQGVSIRMHCRFSVLSSEVYDPIPDKWTFFASAMHYGTGFPIKPRWLPLKTRYS